MQKKLKNYPILHQFLARLYKECDIYEVENMLEYIKDDLVSDYCKCGDSTCSSIYLCSDRLPLLDDDEDEYIETYNSDKGVIVLHFFTNGSIEIEALEYNYPFKEEVISTFNQDYFYTLESYVENKFQEQRYIEAETIVNDYFTAQQAELETIVII